MDISSLSDEEFQKIVRKRLLEEQSHCGRQKNDLS